MALYVIIGALAGCVKAQTLTVIAATGSIRVSNVLRCLSHRSQCREGRDPIFG
jgi:hypothetical protein